MRKLGLTVGPLSLVVLLSVGCSSFSSSGGGSSATLSISGTMGGFSVSSKPGISSESELDTVGYMKNQLITLAAISQKGTGEDTNSAMSNQCADGSYYRVLCSAWSTPPVAAYGDVACNGGASGSFTVSGLPKNTDISCAVRKSTDGASFVPFANLELPAESLSGSTSTINAGGDMQLAITVSDEGSITTTVTAGDNKSDDGIGNVTVNASSMSGFYNLTCPTDISAENLLKCKCFLFSDHDTSKEECIAANGAGISNSASFSVNLNVYEGTIQAGGLNMDDDSAAELPAGAKIYAGTIWGAHNGSGSSCTALTGCQSAKVGVPEGLPTFGGAIDWATANVEDSLSWASTADLKCGNSTVNVTIPAVPGSSANRSAWATWLRTVVDNYAASGKCTTAWTGCDNSIAVEDRDDDRYCVANFAWSVLEKSDVSLPRIRVNWSHMCNETGCGSSTDALPVAAIGVEGVDFNNSTGATEHYSPSPRDRHVMDQFIPNSSGTGGSLKSHSEYSRSFHCSELSGSTSCHVTSGTASNAFLECSIGEDLRINFIPSGTTGQFNTVFDSTLYVRRGEVRGGTMENGASRNAFSQCKEAMELGTTVPSFLARSTKLN